MKGNLTIGILAHVDAGKTSLTECLLHTAGATRTRGSVDKGSAITDALLMEQNRGISIKAATVDFTWNEQRITLVDTPGHIDFSAEVDRALDVLDMVILVISAKEGVQAHTLNLWESIQERNLPVLFFINKIDRAGVDAEHVFLELQEDLKTTLFALNLADLSIPNQPSLVPFEDLKSNLSATIIEQSFEHLAEVDEHFLEAYLEGKTDDLKAILQQALGQIKSQKLNGLIFGSAKLDLGIDLLLDTIASQYSSQKAPFDAPSAKTFKIEYDPKLGRLVHLKSFGSMLKSKDVIWSQSLEKSIKINQIYQYNLGNLEQIGTLKSGEIGVITTSDSIPVSDVLGEEQLGGNFNPLSESVLTVEVVAEEAKDYQKLGEALEFLNIEDPKLEFKWHKEEREFQLKILGPIQTEVLKDSLSSRFQIEANFLSPKVIYKETPTAAAEGYVRYWMPKPCWAIMTFLIEPGELGSGVTFESKVQNNDISSKYQNEVKRAVPWSLKQGIKGWEVTDIRITLIDGSEHNVHSNPGDFLLATPMGILRGLENAGTDLLEPMYFFEIKAHQDYLGSVSSDLNQMKAQLNAPSFEEDVFIITGKVAVAQAMDYSIQFNASTSGKGRLKMTLDGYQKTSTSDEKTRQYKGVSPLDESQWILHQRGAFKAEER
jgi:ribosomal protection tetracycline resistance protein